MGYKAKFKITDTRSNEVVAEKDFTGTSRKADGFDWAHAYQKSHEPKASHSSDSGDQSPFAITFEVVESDE